jgi:GNAT superfamily N-acetyltransferase
VRFTIGPAAPQLPDGLTALRRAADDEGIRIVGTVVERWADASQRFDGPGECLLAATSDAGDVVGIGGLTACPTVAGALRVRRFYVDPGWRRLGVGRRLATAVIERGIARARLLTCNAATPPWAPAFWESMGFEPVEGVAGITHRRQR